MRKQNRKKGLCASKGLAGKSLDRSDLREVEIAISAKGGADRMFPHTDVRSKLAIRSLQLPAVVATYRAVRLTKDD